MVDQRRPDTAARQAAQIRQAQVEVRRSGEQLLLVAEVAHDQRRVKVGVGGDGSNRGPLIALGGEAPRAAARMAALLPSESRGFAACLRGMSFI